MRRGKPDPLGADIVHVSENRRNRASIAGRLRVPDDRVKMFDEKLVHAIVCGKDLDRGSTELSVNLSWSRRHGSQLLTDHSSHHSAPSLQIF